MEKIELVCANSECGKTFTQKRHNQKYCNDECCRLATNRRIMEKYYARRDQRQGKTRWCQVCEETKLSRYNETLICSSCKEKSKVSANNSAVYLLLNSSLSV